MIYICTAAGARTLNLSLKRGLLAIHLSYSGIGRPLLNRTVVSILSGSHLSRWTNGLFLGYTTPTQRFKGVLRYTFVFRFRSSVHDEPHGSQLSALVTVRVGLSGFEPLICELRIRCLEPLSYKPVFRRDRGDLDP